MKRYLFIFLIVLCPFLFICDIIFGSVHIPFDALLTIVDGSDTHSSWYTIITQLRLPRAIAALLAGIALPIAGLLMQTLFRNPLADPYILGISTGASLGVALFSLAGGITIGLSTTFSGTIGIALSALLGSLLILILILMLAPHVQQTSTLLIIGIMFGSFTSAIVSALQYYSNPNEIHDFVLWTMGSFTNIGKNELLIMAICITLSIIIIFLIHNQLDVLLLGENYAKSLGVHISRLRIIIIICAALLASVVTAFAGPIGFIGMTIPHIARFICRTASHKKLIINSLLIGANCMLLCDLLSQMPGTNILLPINTVTALFGAPIVIIILCKERKVKS